ncbi:MAG: 50S ribosomal protein L10 [Dehalococcoidia bacterium]|nr:50S ribosomal protein L10 [Dehalococcoidia bacterium]
MQKEKKSGIIGSLADRLSENDFVVSTTYQGISAQSLAQLRWALAASGVQYHVVKNTLVRIAAEESQRESVMEIIDGSTALGFATDAVEAAKVLRQHARGRDALIEIRGGLLGNKVLSAQQVLALADLPSREVLIAQLAAQLQAPVSRLHRALSWPLQGLHNVLQARIEQVAQ